MIYIVIFIFILILCISSNSICDITVFQKIVENEVNHLQLWADEHILKLKKEGDIFFEYDEDPLFSLKDSFDFKQNVCSNSDIDLLSKFLYIALFDIKTKKTAIISNIFSFKKT